MIEPDHASFSQALADELHDTRRTLEELAMELCMDSVVFDRHADRLQQFDRLAQVIGEIATVLSHRGPTATAVTGIRLDGLRDRLTMVEPGDADLW